jgi:NADH-quinone oxidoreductase subunit C/D
MFNWKDFEKAKEILSHFGGRRYLDERGQHHLRIRPQELLDWIEFIKEDLGYFTLVEMAGLQMSAGSLELNYHFLNMGTHQRLNLHLLVKTGEIVPSVNKFFSHADWMEREQSELLGITFDQEKSPLLKGEALDLVPPPLRYNPNKSEAPYPEESYQWKSYDLFSPVTKGSFEWMLCYDPQKVVDSKMHIGFHHQGFEEILKTKNILQTFHLVDKVNLSAAPTYSIVWAKTLEEIFRIRIPERAQALRIVLLEMARIADHLTVLASICMECGQSEAKTYLDAREKIYELFEKFSGHRHGLGNSCVGGMKEDLPHGWIVEYQNVERVLNKTLHTVFNSLIGQRRFRDLLDGEPVNAQSILQWGVNGPAMRAAGLNFDLRKSQPFYFYQDIDFDIPVGIHGTIYDRFLIRNEEIFQSLRITTQVIDNLPLGEVISDSYNKNSMEMWEILRTLPESKEWHYSAVEAPSGEAGFLVRLDSSHNPLQIKMKTPGFTLAQAMPIFVKGLREEQVGPSFASLGLSPKETDR